MKDVAIFVNSHRPDPVLVKHCPERLVRIEPFIKMMHTRSEYRRLVAAGFSHESLRRSYLGVCLNSGWAGTRQGRYVSRLERGSRAAASWSRATACGTTLLGSFGSSAMLTYPERRVACHERRKGCHDAEAWQASVTDRSHA